MSIIDPFAGGVEVKLTFEESCINSLLKKLNSGANLLNDNYDAQIVSGGFVSSRLFYLHDGPKKKILATAFHIPDKDTGMVHHYDLKIFEFQKRDKQTPWTLKNPCNNLRDQEVIKLREFIDQQDQFVGKKPIKKFYKTFASDSEVSLQEFNSKVKAVLDNPFVDFSKSTEEEILKLTDLFKKVLSGGHIVVEGKVYQELLSSRTSVEKLVQYKVELEEFNELIVKPETTETDMQNFLSDKVWFFGLNYIQSHRRSVPKFTSGLGSQYDFLLEGFNQVYDIVELKGPNELLFEIEKVGVREHAMNNRTDYMFSQKFARALHQVIAYMDEFENSFGHIKEQQPSIRDFMYPKGTIIMSKRSLFPKDGKNSSKYLHLVNRQFSNIDLLTYDDLGERAKIIIDFIEKGL